MNQVKFKHFLITRFNLRNTAWRQDKNKQACLTEEWLEDRFHLFETFCYPSVRQQSSEDFTWLCFFDSETPTAYRRRISEFARMSNFVPLFIDGMDELLPRLKDEIEARANGASHIITSRLDNDDALHRDYIASVQASFTGQNFMPVNVTDGYQIILHDGGRYEVCTAHFAYNPFISLIEATDGFQTILSKPLPEWKEESREGYLIENNYLWAQIVHGRNYANKKNATSFYKSRFPSEEFGITNSKYASVPRALIAVKNAGVQVRSVSRRLSRKLQRLTGRKS